MPWEGHPRTTTPQHRKDRALILAASTICHVCGEPGANEADHIIPVAFGGPPGIENMAPIHDDPCHRLKSAREGAQARWQRNPRKRPPEKHPGLRPGGG